MKGLSLGLICSPNLCLCNWIGFFTSCQWTLQYPNTLVSPLAKPTSDHIPCVVKIATSIPKARIFCFENFWIKQPGFFQLVKKVWDQPSRKSNVVARVAAKLKNLRYELKKW